MNSRRIMLLLSLGLLNYLLVDALVHIEFAASKNRALTVMQKAEIDSIQNIDSLRYEAKKNLDVIRRVHSSYSKKSVTNFWLLAALIIIHAIFLFSGKNKAANDQI